MPDHIVSFPLPRDILLLIEDIADAVRPKGDGGRRVTAAELEKLIEDAAKLAADLAALVTR